MSTMAPVKQRHRSIDCELDWNFTSGWDAPGCTYVHSEKTEGCE